MSKGYQYITKKMVKESLSENLIDALNVIVPYYIQGRKESTASYYSYFIRLTERIVALCPEKIACKKMCQYQREDLKFLYNVLNNEKYFSEVHVTTRKKWQKFITRFYKALFHDNFIKRDPTFGWQCEKGESQKTEPVDENDLQKIIDFEPKKTVDFREKTLILLLADTGIRISSAIALTLDDVIIKEEQEKKTVSRVEVKITKNGVPQMVTVGSITASALIDYIKNHRIQKKNLQAGDTTSNFLFLNNKNKPMTRRNAENQVSKLAEKLNISHIHPHMLRVTFATDRAEEFEYDIPTVKALLGVKSDDMAHHYIRLSQAQKARFKNKKHSVIDKRTQELPNEQTAANAAPSDCAMGCQDTQEPSQNQVKAELPEFTNLANGTDDMQRLMENLMPQFQELFFATFKAMLESMKNQNNDE